MDSANSLSPHSIHEEISALMEKLAFELKKFSQLLKFEHTALHNRSYDELYLASEEKDHLIKNIQRVDHALKAVFHDNTHETTLQDYIKALPDKNELKRHWREQMQMLHKCNKQNHINKRLVDKHINDIHSIIDIMDMNESPNIYNATGVKGYANASGSRVSTRI